MAVNPNTATLVRALPSVEVGFEPAAPAGRPEMRADLLADVLAGLTGEASRCVARAPGRINILGGVSDYSGGWVLNVPLAEEVCVGVQPRSDLRAVVTWAHGADPGARLRREIALAELCEWSQRAVDPTIRNRCAEWAGARSARRIAATLGELISAGYLHEAGPGWTVSLASTMDHLSDTGQEAALSAALMVSLCAAAGTEVDWRTAAEINQRVDQRWYGRPFGTSDAACCLTCQARDLTPYFSDEGTFGAAHRLPEHVALLGIDIGAASPDADDKYARARTATFMGRTLIERILKHQDGGESRWNGYPAQLTADEYLEGIRDRIPSRMKGSEFLSRFGETGDPATRVDSAEVYKVRSRTEHHVYEQLRCRQFLECLSRAIRKGESAALWEAGDLLYASHWSYGQRCGLGSVQADALVTAIRRVGPEADVYGAKITGKGCGGELVVFMRSSPRAREALDGVLSDHEARTGIRPRVLEGSSPGALLTGVLRT
jgi:L-arabinokinase